MAASKFEEPTKNSDSNGGHKKEKEKGSIVNTSSFNRDKADSRQYETLRQSLTFTGCTICTCARVGLTLICLAQLILSKSHLPKQNFTDGGMTNQNQPNLGARADGTSCIETCWHELRETD